MPKTLTPQNQFPPEIPSFPTVGDPIKIAPLEAAIQAVLDRTEYLKNRIEALEASGLGGLSPDQYGNLRIGDSYILGGSNPPAAGYLMNAQWNGSGFERIEDGVAIGLVSLGYGLGIVVSGRGSAGEELIFNAIAALEEGGIYLQRDTTVYGKLEVQNGATIDGELVVNGEGLTNSIALKLPGGLNGFGADEEWGWTLIYGSGQEVGRWSDRKFEFYKPITLHSFQGVKWWEFDAEYPDKLAMRFWDTDSGNTLSTPIPSLRLAPPGGTSEISTNLVPESDSQYSLGGPYRRWTAVWAVTGTIQTSDVREKADIEPCPLGLDFIEKLHPVAFRWKNGEKGLYCGLIAQQVKEALDRVGVKDFGGWVLADPSDPNSPQGLRYEQFIAPIIRAIHELTDRVKALETELGSALHGILEERRDGGYAKGSETQ